MNNKSKLWMAAVLVLILLAAASVLANTIYLPQISKYPTYTPTLSPTATRTATATVSKSPTPTRTVTPTPGVSILEIIYKPSTNPLDEYVLIENTGNNSVDMEGWGIKADKSGARYDFPDNFSLGGDKTVKVWTKDGQNNSSNLYWKQKTPVWNDNSDTAYLKDKDGDTVDVYTYGNASLSP